MEFFYPIKADIPVDVRITVSSKIFIPFLIFFISFSIFEINESFSETSSILIKPDYNLLAEWNTYSFNIPWMEDKNGDQIGYSWTDANNKTRIGTTFYNTQGMQIGWDFPPSTQGKRYMTGLISVFPIEEIPPKDFFNDVYINSAEIQFLIWHHFPKGVESGTSPENLISLAHCSDPDFSKYFDLHKEYFESSTERRALIISENFKSYTKVTDDDYNKQERKQKCMLEPTSTMIKLTSEEIPKTISFDVMGILSDARAEKNDYLPTRLSLFGIEESGYTSSLAEIPVYSKSNIFLGESLIPTLSITYTKTPNQISNVLQFSLSVIIPTVAIIIPAIFWLGKRAKRPD